MQLVWKSIQCIYFSICITIHPIWWIIWRVNHVFTEVDVFCTFSIATVCRMCCTIMQLWLMTNTSFKRVPTILSIYNNNSLWITLCKIDSFDFFARPKNPTFFYLNFSWQKVTTRNGLPHNTKHEISLCMEGEKNECISNRQSHTQVNGIRKLRAVLYYSKT